MTMRNSIRTAYDQIRAWLTTPVRWVRYHRTVKPAVQHQLTR